MLFQCKTGSGENSPFPKHIKAVRLPVDGKDGGSDANAWKLPPVHLMRTEGFHTEKTSTHTHHTVCFPLFTSLLLQNFKPIWKSRTCPAHHSTPLPAPFFPPRAHIHLPGCLPCRAAAAVWRSACAPFSDLGRRARSGCCLRRDAAAGSSAPQQTPCAPGRHGKNWSWTPLGDEKEGGVGGGGGEGADKEGKMNEQISSLNCFWDRLSCRLSVKWATGTTEKKKKNRNK